MSEMSARERRFHEIVEPVGDYRDMPADELDCLFCATKYGEKNEKGVVELRLRLPCGHHSGSDCLWDWLQTSENCPSCRQTVLELPPAEAQRIAEEINNEIIVDWTREARESEAQYQGRQSSPSSFSRESQDLYDRPLSSPQRHNSLRQRISQLSDAALYLDLADMAGNNPDRLRELDQFLRDNLGSREEADETRSSMRSRGVTADRSLSSPHRRQELERWAPPTSRLSDDRWSNEVPSSRRSDSHPLPYGTFVERGYSPGPTRLSSIELFFRRGSRGSSQPLSTPDGRQAAIPYDLGLSLAIILEIAQHRMSTIDNVMQGERIGIDSATRSYDAYVDQEGWEFWVRNAPLHIHPYRRYADPCADLYHRRRATIDFFIEAGRVSMEEARSLYEDILLQFEDWEQRQRRGR